MVDCVRTLSFARTRTSLRDQRWRCNRSERLFSVRMQAWCWTRRRPVAPGRPTRQEPVTRAWRRRGWRFGCLCLCQSVRLWEQTLQRLPAPPSHARV